MPRGWLDEDGPQPEFAKLYGLQEHGSAELKVTPTLVYQVTSKANLRSDQRSKKPGQRGVKAPMNSAATWTAAIRSAQHLLKATGSVANATAVLCG
jgi:hypothetical protein